MLMSLLKQRRSGGFLANRLVHSRACDGLADPGINAHALITSYTLDYTVVVMVASDATKALVSLAGAALASA
jgi:hypothetical protein